MRIIRRLLERYCHHKKCKPCVARLCTIFITAPGKIEFDVMAKKCNICGVKIIDPKVAIDTEIALLKAELIAMKE